MSPRPLRSMLIAAIAVLVAAGCSTAPKSRAERQSLIAEAEATVKSMTAKDQTLDRLLQDAYGYAVFPNVGKGGLIAGAAYGRGVVFEQGEPVGYAELNQASVGAQIGGQTYAELVVFENENALARLKAGNFDLGAVASAVALKAGAAAATRFEGGVAVFQMPKGGLMAAAAITGQRLNYEPMSGSRSQSSGGQNEGGTMTQRRTERQTQRESDGDTNVRVETQMKPIREENQSQSQDADEQE